MFDVAMENISVISTLSVATMVVNDTNGGESHSKHFETYLWIYMAPIIFIVGICGNVLVIAVMGRKRLRGSTTCVYLPLIAVADSATLVTGIIPDWMDFCGFVVLKEVHPMTCKFEKFLFYTAGDVAIWLLVAFTFDRFVAVTFPLKKRMVCVPKRAKYAGFIILIAAIIKNILVFWSRGAVYEEDGSLYKNCGQPQPFTYFEKFVRPWIALILVTVIPFLILLICNCVIIRTLVKAREKQNICAQNIGKSSAFSQTTLMCLSASFTFLICITPSIVLLIGKPYWISEDGDNVSYNIVKSISSQLVFINHSINFFLYCLTGERFRAELVAMFSRKPPAKDAGRFKYTKKVNQVKKKSTVRRKFSLEISSIQVSREGSEERDSVTITPVEQQNNCEVTKETCA